jgi:hypothetical protein
MAQKAESLNLEESCARLAPVVPFGAEKRTKDQTTGGNIKHHLQGAYRRAHAASARSYTSLISMSTALAANMRRGLRRARVEKPLQVVAVAAGTAFALGIVLRIWRSHHE